MSYLNNLWNAIRGVNINYTTEEEFKKNIPSIISGDGFDISKANQISVVYSCIKILADSISRLPIDVYKVENNIPIKNEDDYRYDLLAYQPNNYQNKNKFWSAIEYNRNLHGNAFAKIERNNGFVVGLHLIKPSTYIGSTIKNNQLYYKFKIDDNEIIYNSSDILHFTNVSADGIIGISPIKAMRLSLGVHYEAYKTINNTYKNDLKSSKGLKTPFMNANPKKHQEMVDNFQSSYGGSSNAGSIVALPPGADLIDLQIDPKDAQFISTIEFTTKEIASSFRVPVHMLNILESTKFNSVEAMQLAFINNELGSILKMYRDELQFKLLTLEERKEGKHIKFNTRSLLEVDTKTRTEVYDKQIKGSMLTINEVRLKEGLEPKDGGDEIIIPSNYMFLSQRNQGTPNNPTKTNS